MNLEEFFETKHSIDFPSEKDYVAIYRTFKQFMNSEIHNEVKSVTTRLDNKVYLNDHSANHVKMVMQKVSAILKDCSYLTPYECFILLVAIQIHDAGHIFNGREGHEKTGRNLMEKLEVTTMEKKIIGDIARAHSGKNDPIGGLSYKTTILGQTVRIQELAALLRFGDELADENSRASSYMLEKGLIPEESKLYHAFSESLYNFMPDKESHSIQMGFCLTKQQVQNKYKKENSDIYLLDEIYIRTFKTFQECLYYNRFVNYEHQFHSINIKIEFLDEFDSFFDPISYRIEEKGYPTLLINNVFEYCGTQLERSANKLTGEYVRSVCGF